MPFVIIDTAGQPLRDAGGKLIVLAAREEARRWLANGERVEPYIPRRHDRGTCTAAVWPSADREKYCSDPRGGTRST